MKTVVRSAIIIEVILVFAFELFSQTALLSKRDETPSLYGKLFFPKKEGVYSAIVILHGSSSLEKNYSGYQEYAMKLVDRGYCVLLIDLYAETGTFGAGSEKRFELWDTWQRILIKGVNYLKEMPNVKSDRIGIIGFSRGAWIALTTISDMEDIKVIIDYYGVGKQSLEDVTNLPPTLMLYGTKDYYADSTFVCSLYSLLKSKNRNVELKLYPKAEHGFNFNRNKHENEIAADDAFKKTCKFLEENLASQSRKNNIK